MEKYVKIIAHELALIRKELQYMNAETYYEEDVPTAQTMTRNEKLRIAQKIADGTHKQL